MVILEIYLDTGSIMRLTISLTELKRINLRWRNRNQIDKATRNDNDLQMRHDEDTDGYSIDFDRVTGMKVFAGATE